MEETGVMGTVEEMVIEGVFLGLMPPADDILFFLVECIGILDECA